MILKNIKSISTFLILFFFSINSNSQCVVQTFYRDSISKIEITELKFQFSKNKTIPKDFENQILLALSYFPELKDIKIKFRLKNCTTPLATKPSFFSMFRSAKKRTYIITISEQSTSYLVLSHLKTSIITPKLVLLGTSCVTFQII